MGLEEKSYGYLDFSRSRCTLWSPQKSNMRSKGCQNATQRVYKM